ncbi:IS200/IS605 family transposase [Wenyingzhuangia sp. IMCC45574]
MANTYSQLYFHIVFAVKGRNNLITNTFKEDSYKYITGIISSNNQKLMIINGMPNHIHILLSTKPNCNLSELVRSIKANSSRWINEKNLTARKFEWQNGFGAFTVSQSGVKPVVNYIKKQEEHHKKKSFKDEYVDFLNAYEIDFNEKYIFSE